MNEASNTRRRLRFSLRGLFALVTLAGVLLGLRFGWRPDWIAARSGYLAALHVEWADGPIRLIAPRARTGPPPVTQTAGFWTRFALWFYGEPVQSQLRVPVRAAGRWVSDDELATHPTVREAARLFPEAAIYPERILALPPGLTAPRRSLDPNGIRSGRRIPVWN